MPLLKFSHFAPAFELFGLGGIRVFFAFEPKAIPIHNGFLREQTLLGPDENVFTKSHFKRADADFGDRLALALTPEQLDAYKAARLAEGYAKASINRPLQLIKQAYGFALERNHLSRVPMINYLSEKGNVRKGFCEEPDFRRIYGFLPEYSADLFLFSYVTGMRSGEVKSPKWAFVNKDVIELQPEKSKEGEPRLIPIVGKDLAGILERRKIVRQAKTPDGGPMIADLIFHRNGKPIVDPRKSWKTACKKAGLPGLIPHDLRRCAAKNLDEAGVPRDVAMSITGHKTESMYRRYNIVNLKRQRSGLELAQEFRDSQAAKAAQELNVVAMKR